MNQFDVLSRKCSAQQPSSNGFGHRFGVSVDMELFVDVFDVTAHRPEADTKLIGDHLVTEAIFQTLQSVLLPRA